MICKFCTSVVIVLLNSTVVESTLSSSTEKLLFPVNGNVQNVVYNRNILAILFFYIYVVSNLQCLPSRFRSREQI